MGWTFNFFKEDCSFLSSVPELLWTFLTFRRGVPFPPILTEACNLANFTGSILIREKVAVEALGDFRATASDDVDDDGGDGGGGNGGGGGDSGQWVVGNGWVVGC